VYLALGPVGSALRIEDQWDGAFGGEMSLLRVRERDLVSALGIEVGGQRFSERQGGLVWVDLFAGHRRPWGVTVGASMGVTAEVDQVRPPRWGAQGSLWVFAGIVPYVRAGAVQNSGVFFDMGVKIVLPAIRW
jgi:hypothetical protein